MKVAELSLCKMSFCLHILLTISVGLSHCLSVNEDNNAEDEEDFYIYTSSLTLTSPHSPRGRSNNVQWESHNRPFFLRPSKNVFVWANTGRGDHGVVDTRGVVRYKILSNGRLGRGVITTGRDPTATITQAQAPKFSIYY